MIVQRDLNRFKRMYPDKRAVIPEGYSAPLEMTFVRGGKMVVPYDIEFDQKRDTLALELQAHDSELSFNDATKEARLILLREMSDKAHNKSNNKTL